MVDFKKEVIRYTKEQMIQIHDSPLVKKPDSLPCLSTWFGEDPGSPILKNILNGSSILRTTVQDKNVLLTPQKANFVSSLYGGLKKNDEKQMRHKLDNNNNNRTHRGNYVGGEKGFNKPKYTNQSPHKRYNNNKRDIHHNHHHYNNNQSNRVKSDEHNNERIPEWLDYEPKEQKESTSVNDLESWKSSMKRKDGVDEKREQKEAEQAFSFLTLDQKNGFDEFFIHETEVLPTRRDNQTGSRFAKFFAKREEDEEEEEKEIGIEPRSISVNDLFGNGRISQQSTENSNNVRVLSEDDILRSLGAKKKSDDVDDNTDAIGFNRVLQILSQPKPVIEEENRQQSSMPTTPINELPVSLNKTNSKPSTPTLPHHRFSNTNLPTAVLRQMSARSSPSMQTSKSLSNTSRDTTVKQQPVPFFPYQAPHQQMMDSFPMSQMIPPRPNESFLPPHLMMQPPPLPLTGVPMPPHHLPLIQGQFPIQRDMMHPIPPYVMTNGIPPQLFNKSQGWERQ